MRRLLLQLVHDFGNARAIANARRERDEISLVYARLDDLERRHAPLAPALATAA